MDLLDVIIPSLKKITPEGSKVNKEIGTIIRKEPDATPRRIEYGKVTRSGGTGDWNDPEFDFHLIARCLSTEAIFRRTVDKYVELILTNGYKIIGKNPKAVDYVKLRLLQVGKSTRTHFDMLLRDISQQLVTYSNCFIEKVRSNKYKIKGNAPVIGYYVVDATAVVVKKKDNGRVLKYKQIIGERDRSPEWSPDDMIHIYKSREPGLTFGTPMVAPVIDDIRALRRIEENVELLTFTYATPLFQYKVGDDDHPANDTLITSAANNVKNKPADSMLITPYYHNITAIGSEGRAIRLEGYLNYFRERVFAGLGTSAVALGLGGSANRATSEVLERSMYVTVRDFQKIIQNYIELEIFSELLVDGGFDPYEDSVTLFFPDVDIDTKIKIENHMANMYQTNLRTSAEAREETGKDPFTDEEYYDTYLFNVELPKAMVQSLDEPVLQTYGPGILKRINRSIPGGARKAASLDMPKNQYGQKLAPGSTKDMMIDSEYTIVDTTTRYGYNDLMYDKMFLDINNEIDKFRKYIIDTYSMYGNEYTKYIDSRKNQYVGNILSICEMYIYNSILVGVTDLFEQVGRKVDHVPSQDIMNYGINLCRKWIAGSIDSILSRIGDGVNINTIFDVNLYRFKLGSRNIVQKMYNIGFISGGKVLGYEKFSLISGESDDICKLHNGKVYNIDSNVSYDDIPPGYMTHPLCTCKITVRN